MEEVWLSSSESEEEISQDVPEPLWQRVFFLMLWQGLYRISNAALNVLFALISTFIKVFGNAFGSQQDQRQQN